MRYLRWIAAAVAVLSPAYSFADTPSFDNITLADYDKIVKELSANFAYSTVTPASSLGGLWGFELGAVAGVTKTPEILALVKRNNASFKEDKFPHAAALLRVGAPYGLTAEAMVLPKIKASDLEISQYAGALMWTITDVFFKELPVSFATKAFFTKTSLGYKQRIQNASTSNLPVDAAIDFDNTSMGAQALVSYKISVFEPYLGIGYSRSEGNLSVNAATAPNATFFLTGAKSASSKPSSTQFLGGLDLRLAFFTLGGEYQRSFGTSSLTGRVSFRF